MTVVKRQFCFLTHNKSWWRLHSHHIQLLHYHQSFFSSVYKCPERHSDFRPSSNFSVAHQLAVANVCQDVKTDVHPPAGNAASCLLQPGGIVLPHPLGNSYGIL